MRSGPELAVTGTMVARMVLLLTLSASACQLGSITGYSGDLDADVTSPDDAGTGGDTSIAPNVDASPGPVGICAQGGGDLTWQRSYQAEDMPSLIGTTEANAISVTSGETGHLVYGPYERDLPAGCAEIGFRLMTTADPSYTDATPVVTLDVNDATDHTVLARETIVLGDFAAPQSYQTFTLHIRPGGGENLEWRVYWEGMVGVRLDRIDVAVWTSTDPAAVDAGTPDAGTSSDCPGGEVVCCTLASATEVEDCGGEVVGGEFTAGGFRPANQGGLRFALSGLSEATISFDIDGTIPNWELGELDGGKVSLVDIAPTDAANNQTISWQRMYHDYRDGGRFRLFMVWGQDWESETTWCLTIPELAGDYSMRDWPAGGTHHFSATWRDNVLSMTIDGYVGICTYPGGFTDGPIELMLGARLDQLPNQHAQTVFKNLRIVAH